MGIHPRPIKTDEAPFTRWLVGQRDRRDRVGAFARAALGDPDWPGGDNLKLLKEYLRHGGSRDFVFTTLNEAWAEYENYVIKTKRRTKNKEARSARKNNRQTKSRRRKHK